MFFVTVAHFYTYILFKILDYNIINVPSVPLGVMELLLMWELSRLGPLGDSLLPLTRL